MKLLQFTDIHLTTPGNTIGGRDPNANFDRALDHAMALHSDADALFITGDLSDRGEADDDRRLKTRIATLPLPVHLMIGNHDDRATFLRARPDHRGNGGFMHRVVRLPLCDAIPLDTCGPDTHTGHFCAARARWRAAQLALLDGPVWIFMRHNPVPIGMAPMDRTMRLDAALLAETLRHHAGKIRHIFQGHCHLPLSGALHGIPFSAPRGTNHAGWPDVGATRPPTCPKAAR